MLYLLGTVFFLAFGLLAGQLLSTAQAFTLAFFVLVATALLNEVATPRIVHYRSDYS